MDPLKLRFLLKKIGESNDERAFSVFFDHYHTRLIELAMLFVPRYDQAEEVVADVFLKILQKKATLLGIEKFEGYLFKMVKHECLNYLKKRKKQDSGNVLVDDIQDYHCSDKSDPEKTMINNDLGRLLHQVIDRLPPKRRLVFKMVKDDNMSYREVGKVLEISERTVEVHLKLAIQDLRKVLSSYYHENDEIIPISKKHFLTIFL
ncbi:RNA polymerase sigma-70 factor [Cyclobacterium roseum]|uniref:RNA polymerase sigma-70 factor n=1 Tax=Cyclobacterium roseum TaxID=2666137 RepID=UPI001390BD04|nr:RNA polymerase sigma-70 factor [Cyclobacterium roseum]